MRTGIYKATLKGGFILFIKGKQIADKGRSKAVVVAIDEHLIYFRNRSRRVTGARLPWKRCLAAKAGSWNFWLIVSFIATFCLFNESHRYLARTSLRFA